MTGQPADEAYAAIWARTREANQRYQGSDPGELDRLRTVLRQLDNEDVRIPDGHRLRSR